MDYRTLAHHQVDNVSFGAYTATEIQRMSVLEVVNVMTFDALGHPNSKGLCDLAFGPLNKNDVCSTCFMGFNDCPGHFGHINLPLPVHNPVFLRQMFQLMKLVCLECHRLLVSPVGMTVFVHQLDALERGLDYMLDEIESMAEDIIRNSFSSDVLKQAELISNEIKKRMKALCNTGDSSRCRAVAEKRQDFMKRFIQGTLLKPLKTCHHCSAKRMVINVVNNSVLVRSNPGRTRRRKDSEVNDDSDTENTNKSKSDGSLIQGKAYITPTEAKEHFRQLWLNESEILKKVFGLLRLAEESADSDCLPTDVFFLDVICVPPNKFRPVRMLNGRTYENEQTASLNQVMIAASALAAAVNDVYDHANPNNGKEASKLHYAWQRLQILSNRLFDSDMDKMSSDKVKFPGVKQLIEKKEGLFRKHMMGKRVNYAARSVISPDPYIMADEVGVPIIFAKKLTYPEPVTPHNLKLMQMLIINGPEVHPGAVTVQFEDGNIIRLKADDPSQRLALSERITSALNRGHKVPIVHRHLTTGDVMLLNRQPTLHKPSIMAHKARIIQGEKTLRMHYANCKSYNADFDGDEMNAHFPQSELARSEAYNLASVNKQYLVPKDGSPLSGLIQDHIVAATLLSVRGTFFSRPEFQNLVFGCLSFTGKCLKLPRPALLKPYPLWTGKQVIGTVIQNLIPDNRPPPSVCLPTKVKPKSFEKAERREFLCGGDIKEDEMCESQVVIFKGELMCGIIDKSSIGNQQYGLVHCCYELYGGETSTAMLSAFARLATDYLQLHHGLTLGIHDILVKGDANKKRRKAMKRSEKIGAGAVMDALGIDPAEFTEDLKQDKMLEAHTHKDAFYMKQLDNSFKVHLDKINNDISGSCLGKGLVKQFPENNLQLMIQAGAKGGTVNALQISCLLGQIELEGRRPPLMMSGKSLPSFERYDSSPRAGGFIAGRFLTGIRPQEFFFHCMAGREGLIDTAVKTSRSGYLQRCLIKHLEGLKVNYDLTVRDSDGSVVQFQYGEDGLDISKSQLLNPKAFSTVMANKDALKPSKATKKAIDACTDYDGIRKYNRQIERWEKHNGKNRLLSRRGSAYITYFVDEVADYFQKNSVMPDKEYEQNITSQWFQMDKKLKKKYNKYWLPCPDPVNAVYQPNVHIGVLSEKLDSLVASYMEMNSVAHYDIIGDEKIQTTTLRDIVNSRYMTSLCEPGEAVGLLAAQSVGEPSTQMTLNTFHFAGRGEMNVTLGIPRLREILMTASPKISTPSMDIPIRTDLVDETEKKSELVRLMLSAVKLSDILEYVDVTEVLHLSSKECCRVYNLKFQFLNHKYYKKKYNVTASKALNHFEEKFVLQLLEAIDKKMKSMAKTNSLYDHTLKGRDLRSKTANDSGEKDGEDFDEKEVKSRAKKAMEDEEASSDDEESADVDTSDAKRKARRNQDLDYEEPEVEEIEIESDHEKDELEERVHSDEKSDGDEEKEKEVNISKSSSKKKPMSSSKKKPKKQELLEAEAEHRCNRVTAFSPFISKYEFDTEKEEWCSIDLKFEVHGSKFDMASLISAEAKKTLVYKIGNIDRAFLVKDNEAARKGASFDKMIKTEGVNFLSMVKFSDILDLNRMYSNDIHAISRTYGIEAAAKALKREIANVFAVYGIHIDARHLSLISDYMTFSGAVKGMNRMAMSANSSPIQQMTFETTTAFLKAAALIGMDDDLSSPSARIFAGRPVNGGTGMFGLIQNPNMKAPPAPRFKLNESFSVKWSPSNRDYKRKSEIQTVKKSFNKRIKFDL
ncbi:DNA-directed RNA polymerase I subunit RPA1 [Halotydeus destructor]|nr:DNA-directed RNA polymerase I subunit RPA1 [Halotydeus destructor]